MFRKVFLGRPVVWKGGCLQVRLVQKWETASHACLACNCGWFSNSCLLGITFSFVASTRFSLGRSSMVWSVFKLSPSYCPYSPQKLCFVFSVIFFPSSPSPTQPHRCLPVLTQYLSLLPSQAHWLLTLAQPSLPQWKAETLSHELEIYLGRQREMFSGIRFLFLQTQ